MNGKFLFAAAVTVMAAASCTKQLESVNTENNDVKLVPVSIQVGIEATKTSLDGYKVSWNKGDKIAVVDGTKTDGNNEDIHCLEAESSGSIVKFTGQLPEGIKSIKAFYPYEMVVNNSKNGTNFQINYPAEQKAVVGDMIPLAFNGSIDTVGIFRPVCALVKASVSGSDIKSITLRVGKDESVFLSGPLININTFKKTSSRETNGSKNMLTLIPSEGTTFTPGNYYFPVFASSKDRTLTPVTLYYTKTDGNILVKESKNALVTGRGKVYTLPGSETEAKENSIVVNMGGATKEFTSKNNIIEGIVDVTATGNFTVTINGVEGFGFTKYSGAGGIGTVNNEFSALPYCNIKDIEGCTRKYSVRKAMGSMSIDDSEPFWLNLENAGKMYIKVDNSGCRPTYFLKLQEADDPNVIIDQTFDLICWGGEYIAPCKGPGSTGETQDPYVVSTKDAIGLTSLAYNGYIYFAEGMSHLSHDKIITDEFAKALDIEGFYAPYAIGFRPNCIQAGATSKDRYADLYTPYMKALTGSANVTVEMDLARLANKSLDALSVTIEGDGTFTSASVNITHPTEGQLSNTYTTFDQEGKVLKLADDNYFPHTATWDSGLTVNNQKNKPISHYTLNITGATANTRIVILDDRDTFTAGSKDGRFQMFKYKVTKQ